MALRFISKRCGRTNGNPKQLRPRQAGSWAPKTTKKATMANEALAELTQRGYQYGFVSDIAADRVAPGLSEDVIRLISSKKGEPPWLLEWRLAGYRKWLTMKEPTWANVS